MSDRISNLPESLLLHILSSKSLQTKDVVATMLLSKLWRSLWLSIPKLEFHDTSFHTYESFLQFINATLNLVDPKSLKMFALKCEYFDVSPDKIDNWVNTVLKAALKSKLVYLNLSFAPGFYYTVMLPLPSSIFRSSTIRMLKLVRANVSNLSTVHLPSLEALHMMFVEFSDAESLGMLLSGCVRLQELLLLGVELPENTNVEIGKLHHLVTALVPGDLFPIQVFSNVRFLCLQKHDFFAGDYDIPTFRNLTHLEIRLAQNGWSKMVSCLPSFPELETLIIREDVKGLEWSMETSPDDVPTCVSSHLKTFALSGFNYLQSEFEIVGFIMNHAKALRSVIVWTRDHPGQDAGRLVLLQILSSYPKCSQNCLLCVDDPVGSIDETVYSKLVSDKDFSYYFKV